MMIRTDVIVLGAGLSGLVAAAEAHAAGKTVAILDQEPEASVGGQAHWSFGGLFLVDSPEQRKLGVKDSEELALSDWMASAGFDRSEDALAREWAAAYVHVAAGEKRSWLKALGVACFPWCSGPNGVAMAPTDTAKRYPVSTWRGVPALPLWRRFLPSCARAWRPAGFPSTSATGQPDW